MILIRLDISDKIGTGHFRRMYNLFNSVKHIKKVYLINSNKKIEIYF